MSESKHTHTPGPWRVDNNGGDRWSVDFEGPSSSYIPITGGRKEPVAFAVEPTAYGTAVEANARLIAAAPELLEALRVAQHTLVAAQNYRVTDLTVEVFDAHLANGVPRDRLEFMTDYTGELARIDAAIAKATGGEA